MKKVMYLLFAMVTLSSVALSSNLVSADNDSVVDEINITVPVSCTLSGTGMNTHNATINNGQYNSAIGETNLKAFCNDNNGFAIYAIGYTDDTDGKNVLTNSGLGSTYDIITGTATSGNTSNWAMKLSTVTSPAPTYPIIIAGSTDDTEKEQGDPDYTSFQEVPDDYERVAYRTAGTDIGTGAEGTTLKTTYQAYINATQPAGTYTGQVKYTLVHSYNAAAPIKCNPNATTISQVLCMQDFANVGNTNRTAIVNSMTTGAQYTLKDKRDGKEYKIAKLADGNVWMTQNIDLDIDSTKTYTNEDTDLGYNTTTGKYDTANWTPARSTYASTANHIHDWCVGGTWSSPYGSPVCITDAPESYDPGNLYWNGIQSNGNSWYEYDESCNLTNNTPFCDQTLNPVSTYVGFTGTTQYHLGNYYNWTAAIAVNDSSTYKYEVEPVEQSICPSGWTLPRVYDTDGSYKVLWGEYGWDSQTYAFNDASILWASPLHFAITGEFSGRLSKVGYEGNLWSAVPDGNQYSVRTYYSSDGGAIPSWNIQNGFGYPIRCIARPVPDSLTY